MDKENKVCPLMYPTSHCLREECEWWSTLTRFKVMNGELKDDL